MYLVCFHEYLPAKIQCDCRLTMIQYDCRLTMIQYDSRLLSFSTTACRLTLDELQHDCRFIHWIQVEFRSINRRFPQVGLLPLFHRTVSDTALARVCASRAFSLFYCVSAFSLLRLSLYLVCFISLNESNC